MVSAYQIPYQSDIDETSFIGNGSITGQLLQYNQGSAPSWVNATGLTVAIANSLSGGAAGSIPYQMVLEVQHSLMNLIKIIIFLLITILVKHQSGKNYPQWLGLDIHYLQ